MTRGVWLPARSGPKEACTLSYRSAARGRPAGAASLAARLDAPLGRRGAGDGVAVRGAATHPYCGGSPPRSPQCRLRRWLVGAALRGERCCTSRVCARRPWVDVGVATMQQSASVAMLSSSAHPCIPDAFPECFVEFAFEPAWMSLLTPWISRHVDFSCVLLAVQVLRSHAQREQAQPRCMPVSRPTRGSEPQLPRSIECPHSQAA